MEQEQTDLNNTPSNYKIAFILDGFVQEVVECSERFGSLLLSGPIARNVTGLDIPVGFQYDVNKDAFIDANGEIIIENRS